MKEEAGVWRRWLENLVVCVKTPMAGPTARHQSSSWKGEHVNYAIHLCQTVIRNILPTTSKSKRDNLNDAANEGRGVAECL